MKKRPVRQSFADIVRDVESTPQPIPEPKRPGIGEDGVLTDPDGREYRRVSDEVGPARALELATAGAVVAWDPCGCGGYCGFDWFNADDVSTMVASGPPTIKNNKRHRGNISEWRSDPGVTLLLAQDDVRWSDLMG